MRQSRLLSILILLQTHGRLAAAALAGRFEVSVRTIYRDIDELAAAGVPVYSETGRNGGFSLREGYRTTLTGMTPAESEALLFAGVGKAAADLGIGADAAAAQLKMLASLPSESGSRAGRIAARFHLDPVHWYSRAEAIDTLPRLAAAVWGDRRVRIRYESWKAEVRREVDPLGLVLKAGVWYLVAGIKGNPRSYRVSNIRELEVLDVIFRRPARFDLGRYWTAASRDFEARLLRDRAIVRLSPEGLRLLREIHAAGAEAADASHRPCRPAGWIEAEIPIEGVEYTTRLFLRLGTEVEVRAPIALRRAMAREARRIAALHTA